MIPKITVNLQNGTLGSVSSSEDGITGLVIGCNPGAKLVAGTIYELNSLDDAIAAEFDTVSYAYQQVKEYYSEAGTGSRLYVLILANTVTLTQMADIANATNAKKLLDAAGGNIKLLGICREPADGYTPTTTKGMDDDVITAVTKMQELAESYHAAFTPFVGLIEGRNYSGVPANLDDLTKGSDNFVGVPICASDELHTIDANAASVGLALGRSAFVPVQRKIARVKDGGLSITGAYLGAAKVESANFVSVEAKGYITIGVYANKSGYYFLDDTLATAQTDDYKTISMRRTMNKMVRLVFATYINELNDDIELDAEGKMAPGTAKYYQGLIENAVNASMTGAGELSSFSAYVDMNQNVLSTGKIQIRCAAVPKGYSQEIVVTLGFSNPALSA